MPQALKALCIIHIGSWKNSPFSLLALWGNQNGLPSRKVKSWKNFQTKLASLNVSLVRRVTSSPSSVGRRRHGGGPLRSAVVATWPWLASSSLTDHLCLCCDAIYCKSCSMLARTGCVVKLRHAPRRSRISADGFSPSSSKPNNLNERLEVGREGGREEGRKEEGAIGLSGEGRRGRSRPEVKASR